MRTAAASTLDDRTTLSRLQTPPHVTLLVVTYNGKTDTLECLDSLSKLTFKNTTILLVDQNSQDGTAEAVHLQFPYVQVIKNSVNDGITGGNNLGMRKALEFPTDYLFILNNDMIVEPGLLEKLLGAMESDPGIGIMGPTLLYYDQPNTVCWGGSDIDWRGRGPIYHCDESIAALNLCMQPTGYVPGCAIIRRAVLEQVGLFDNRFFIYFDDTDFCARIRRAGWKVIYLPSGRAWHKISRVKALIGEEFGIYHWQRNRLLYLWKNGRPRWLGCLWCIGGGLKTATLLLLKGQRRKARALLRAVRDSLTGRWGNTFFSYKW